MIILILGKLFLVFCFLGGELRILFDVGFVDFSFDRTEDFLNWTGIPMSDSTKSNIIMVINCVFYSALLVGELHWYCEKFDFWP